MAVYRFARPEEEEAILDLIDLVFSKTGSSIDFASLVPKVYGRAGFSAYHAVAEQAGRLVGTVAMLPVTVHMGDTALRGGYIGSVAVHSKYRGQGHMRALMDLLIAEAKSRGYDFLALGGQRQRYGYWGFEVCGADKVWYPAEAEIVNEEITLTAKEVPEPLHARYAFLDWPEVNVFGENGLPLAPFWI